MMSNLTSGELRYISESTNSWMHIVSMLKDAVKDIPQETLDRISELKSGFEKEFLEFYSEKKQSGTELDGDQLLYAFEDEWEEKHPEFYDMKALFSGCPKEALEKAEPTFNMIEEEFFS